MEQFTAATPTRGPGALGFVRRRPLTTFFLWFFVVGQALAFAPRYLDTGVAAHWFIVASTLIGLLLPAVVITAVLDGRDGLRLMLRRTLKLGGPPVVYIVGLIMMPLLAVGLGLALFGAPEVPTTTIVSSIGSSIVVGTIVGLLLNNLWEEVAWMGFVQARLQDRHGPMRAALVAAPLFALQHVALFIENDPIAFVVILVAFAVINVFFRAYQAWNFNRSGGSLLLVGLIHALSNAMAPGSGFGDGYLRQLYPGSTDGAGVLHTAAIALIGIAVIAATRGRLGVPRGHRSERLGQADVQPVAAQSLP